MNRRYPERKPSTDREVFRRGSVRRTLLVVKPLLLLATATTLAQARGTMDFSGATALMGTFKSSAMYAGAVICLGGLILPESG